MKTIIALFAFALFSVQAVAQKLTVTVDKIKGDKGNILIGVYDSKENYLKKPVDGKAVKITGGKVTVVFDNLKPGTYAVTVLHDENENKELDTKTIGIPKEGYGFSNNAKGKLGPASFENASFKFSEDKSMSIDLKYM